MLVEGGRTITGLDLRPDQDRRNLPAAIYAAGAFVPGDDQHTIAAALKDWGLE